MNARLFDALQRCRDSYTRVYFHRQKSMEELAELGFAKVVSGPIYNGMYGYEITPAGRAKLAELEGKK